MEQSSHGAGKSAEHDLRADADRVRREVVSFVRRSNRMTPSQRKAWDQHHDQFVLEVPRTANTTSVAPGSELDLAEVFGRTAPLIVEIGPGMGDSLVPMAAARQGANFLAFEVYEPAAAAIVAKLAAAGITNVRIVVADAVTALQHLLTPEAIDRLWTFFPDPWPKARHHKRRMIDTAFADLVASRMRRGGAWRLATDWEGYATWMRDVLDEHPAFSNGSTAGWSPRWEKRPVTKFEQRGLDAGRAVFDLTYNRV
ncbi:tRNA (guanosine(46)-N7)-methyltransferase TrmB [Propionibacteriaceae bacterium Y1685]|uniref:tRNA (guanosine(46)-N7)-methyltransferase TrmB n=1 Tax=Microlunatus sp. Y1700 TaxID=3418487 RepID=UPI003B7865B9